MPKATSTSKPKSKLEDVKMVAPYQGVDSQSRLSIKKYIIALGIVIVGVWLWKNRSLFVVATVNNRIITRSQLNKMLVSRYGEQTLSSLISQKIVEDEVAKHHINIAQEKIAARVDELKKSLPKDVTFEQALSSQGTSLKELEAQIKLQLAVEQILNEKITIDDSAIDKYVKDNQKYLTASTAAEKREEAKEAIRRQKFEEELGKWLTEIQSKAKIVKLLNS